MAGAREQRDLRIVSEVESEIYWINPMDIKSTEFWFERAIMWAHALVPNDKLMHKKILDIRELALEAHINGRGIRELIYSMLDQKRANRLASAKLFGSMEGTYETANRPPLPLYIDLNHAASSAVIALGSDAVPYLHQALSEFPEEAPEQIWLLGTIATIGDPRSEILIDSIEPATIRLALQSEHQIGKDEISPEHFDPDYWSFDIEATAQECAKGLKHMYQISRSGKLFSPTRMQVAID